MKHLSVEDKRRLGQLYINGGCTMEQEQSWEMLLLEDAEAMDIHIQLLSSVELSMPDMMDSIQFTDDVMNSIPVHLYEKEESNMEQRRRRWFEHPIFHYTVAACLTLLFLSTGLFDKLGTGDLTFIAKEPKQTMPYSEKMMNITVTWLDQLKR
ncbi:hypothetical protein [Paenibacillus antarcticus]|uniref:Uncharacterized protein n=1 Tax=Paenibacillus antarcticus TaxID=253703 RepID=A0A162MBR3_9BACL|nr:hypothetical protein [Paenibacillus antarcticus]OAB46845.1 hypothetical protein PBAT_09265 [Paenibacillus antarcticus]